MKVLGYMRMTSAACALALGMAASLAGQEATAHDHAIAAAAEISKGRRTFSPELQKMKSLAGRWEGTTFRAREGTNPIAMTYTVTGAGSAVVETMFPGTPGEMTTIYHDDSSGRLVADHYCTAANQPKLRLIDTKDGKLNFELSPESDIKADVEGHAHNLTVTFNADGTLVHDWLNHYLGEPSAKRNIILTRK